MPRRQDLLVCLALTAAVLAVYFPVWCYGAVLYDDDLYGPANEAVRVGFTAESLHWAWTSQMGFWEPLTWMSLQLDAELYGPQLGGYHQTNVLLHTACVLLLYGALRRMTGCFWPPVFVAALVATHPLNVEPVAWLAERKGLISSFFWMLSLWAYAAYTRRGAWSGLGRYAILSMTMLAGIMAKPMQVTLPAILLLLDYWPLKRLQPGARQPVAEIAKARATRAERSRVRVALERKSLPSMLLEKLPLAAISAVFCLVAVRAEHHVGALTWLPLSLEARVSHALVAYLQYLGKAFCPMGLANFYPHPGEPPSPWPAVGGALALASISGLAWRWAKRRPYFLVGWCWYLITLLPVIGLVQVGRHGLADRYMYVPLIGLAIAMAWGAADWARSYQASGLFIGWGAAILLILGVASAHQLAYWRDNASLWAHALEVAGENALAHDSFAVAILGHDPDLAINHLKRAIQLEPNYAMAHYNLGIALGRVGRLAESVPELEEAQRLNPENADIYYNLGVAHGRLGHTQQAADSFREAVRLNPGRSEAHFNLAVALKKLGQADEARREYDKALQLDPTATEKP